MVLFNPTTFQTAPISTFQAEDYLVCEGPFHFWQLSLVDLLQLSLIWEIQLVTCRFPRFALQFP